MSAPITKTILIVEDDAEIREGLHELLEGEGYKVEQSANGQEALDRLSSLTPSAILLDLMMPVMNGPVFLETIHKLDPNISKKIPILLLTAVSGKIGALQGVKTIIRKPIDTDLLLTELAKC